MSNSDPKVRGIRMKENSTGETSPRFVLFDSRRVGAESGDRCRFWNKNCLLYPNRTGKRIGFGCFICNKLSSQRMKLFAISFFFTVLGCIPQAISQELELSAGLTYKHLLGAQRQVFEPLMGIELAAARQEQSPFSADMVAWGATVGVFRMNTTGEGTAGQFQQIVETTATFRYDLYYSDALSFFYGAAAGFAFTTLHADQPVSSSENTSTQIYTRGLLSPNAGVNIEFSRSLALYYKLQYDLGKYFGSQPNWGDPSSKWNHRLGQSAGVRLRFW